MTMSARKHSKIELEELMQNTFFVLKGLRTNI